MIDSSYGFVSPDGRTIKPRPYFNLGLFDHGYAIAYFANNKAVLIDTAGNEHEVLKQESSEDKLYKLVTIEGKTVNQDNFLEILGERGKYKLVKRFYDTAIFVDDTVLAKLPTGYYCPGKNPQSENCWIINDSNAFEFTGVEGKSKFMECTKFGRTL